METEHPVQIERCDDSGFGLMVELHGSPQRVFAALTDREQIERWWRKGVVLEGFVGGTFCEPWIDMSGQALTTRGQVLAAVRDQLLQWTWADAAWPGETTVELTLEPYGLGCLLRLDHDGFLPVNLALGDDILSAHLIGWRRHLRNLQRYIEDASR